MAFPSILLWNHNERALACQGRLGQFLVTSQEAALARVAVVLSPLTMLKESVGLSGQFGLFGLSGFSGLSGSTK